MVDVPPNAPQAGQQTSWYAVVGPAAQAALVPASNSDAVIDEPPNGQLKVDRIEHETAADMQANRALREKYAGKAYDLAAGCITIWALLLGLQGIIKAITGIEMWTEKVIIAVTTGVTVSVLAAFLGVIRGLFPAKDKK